ncbi:M20 metallopeptidase family protein [Clostridium tagluense]|uniref:M20 metallopeptidase family protein n=1 Tax=Clostridium tagluense TaxID=360422 RepID=UPI001CF3416F|nr:amidohydrolase [Clostridium tagluense]MCB2298765.1 amidohydrolase [Clostridium tagluense]
MDNNNQLLCINLRHKLHENAEISGNENKTMEILIDFLRNNTKFDIIAKDGYFIAEKIVCKDAMNIAFRADMDAISMIETTDIEYKSNNTDAAHKCGHDGHCAILAGLALKIEKKPIEHRNIFLLFQPSEEVGEGARKIVQDGFLVENKIDEMYSLHNIPGYERGTILYKRDVFACASKGIIITLMGKPSHAAYPEYGINPSSAAADITNFLNNSTKSNIFKGMVLCTIVNINIGERAFGTAASSGEILLTLRGENEEDLMKLENHILVFVDQCCRLHEITFNISYSDEFPETRNHDTCINKILEVCNTNDYNIEELQSPFRWSEDFGYYLKNIKGAMFGLGDGKLQPQLHTADYDFPDSIIKTGVDIFYSIATLK